MTVKQIKNARGQMTLELTLMLVVIVMGVSLVSRFFRDNEIVASIVSGPWQHIDGMIRAGVWDKPDSAVKRHPATFDRLATPVGEDVK